MDTPEDITVGQAKRCRVADSRLAFVVDEKIVDGRAQWWDSGMEAHWDVAMAALLEGVDAAISAWAAGQRNKSLGQELVDGENRGSIGSKMSLRRNPPKIANWG